MATEIERKFLVKNETFKSTSLGILFRQGYLNVDKERTVRVRVTGEHACITIKGITRGMERLEFEYPIPLQDANELLDMICVKPLIEKLRYTIVKDGHLWEVDEFIGDNRGLIVAEVELQSADDPVILPDWVGEEVTGDERYYNSCLVNHPFKEWNNRKVIG